MNLIERSGKDVGLKENLQGVLQREWDNIQQESCKISGKNAEKARAVITYREVF
jgi:hypothetical protein